MIPEHQVTVKLEEAVVAHVAVFQTHAQVTHTVALSIQCGATLVRVRSLPSSFLRRSLQLESHPLVRLIKVSGEAIVSTWSNQG